MLDTKQKQNRVLYVQPDDVVEPIRERRTEDGGRVADKGEPIMAKDLWKETEDDG